MKKLAIFLGTFILLLLGAAGGLVAFVCSNYGQQLLKGYAVEMLADRLQTKVELDSINVSFRHGGMELYGLRVDDRAGERMAQFDTLDVAFKLRELWNRKVVVTYLNCASPKLNTYRTSADSVANYLFVIDTFKKDKDKQTWKNNKMFKLKLVLDLAELHVKTSTVDMRYEARYDGGMTQHLTIGALKLNIPDSCVEVDKLHASTRWYVDKSRVFLSEIGHVEGNFSTWAATLDDVYVYKPGVRCRMKSLVLSGDSKKRNVKMNGINLVVDNGKPHKHQGNAKRGWFDAGHLNIKADASVSLLFDPMTYKKGDRMNFVVHSIKGVDKGSGLRADKLSFAVSTNLKTAVVSKLNLRDQNTTVVINKATLTLPDKKEGRTFAFNANNVHGITVLKDIARPFAPALSKFTTPLMYSTNFSGDVDHLTFRNVVVKTKDGRLGINAEGGITGLRGGKEALKIHFNVGHMHARNGIKEQIIKHFVYRKSLVGLLQSAGDVSYTGTVDIGYKYEQFKGKVNTSLGDIDASVYLDEKTKYMTCSANTDDFDAATMFDNQNLKKLAITADASFDIAGNEASKKLHRKRGKLPAGWLKGTVKEVKYKFVTCRNVTFDLDCDGDVAKGTIDMNKLFLDLAFDFSFTDTKFGQDLKIKPHVHVHNIITGIKTLIQRGKEKRAAKKAAKAVEKEAKAKEKEAKKAEKAAAKAEKKAQKAAAKAERKAQKAAEKEAKKKAKE